jgi:hypothetical protein
MRVLSPLPREVLGCGAVGALPRRGVLLGVAGAGSYGARRRVAGVHGVFVVEEGGGRLMAD